MRRVSDKQLRELLAQATAHGCVVSERRRHSHFRIDTPGGGVVFCSATPSDRRAYHKIRSNLRQAGVPL